MKIGIVTGASSGMGKQFVTMIVRQMPDLDEIWIVARRKERLLELARMYGHAHFRLLTLDLQNPDDINALEKELAKEKPEIKVFVHSAGFGIMGQIHGISRDDQAEMVDVNCRSMVSITPLVLPFMAKGGRMIYMASASAFLPQPGFAVYAASKAFALSYVRALRAEERRRGLKITAVCPGAVKTEFFNRALVTESLPAYKKLVMADPVKVVKKAWKDNGNNVEVSVYGPMIKTTRLLAKVLPHRLFLAFMKGKESSGKR